MSATSIPVIICGANFHPSALFLHLTEMSAEVYECETRKVCKNCYSDRFPARAVGPTNFHHVL
jgi:hypothetical protein